MCIARAPRCEDCVCRPLPASRVVECPTWRRPGSGCMRSRWRRPSAPRGRPLDGFEYAEGTRCRTRTTASVSSLKHGVVDYGFHLDHQTRGRAVIGEIGFVGPPQRGAVTIGYAIVPAARRQGYATEAVAALTAWAIAQPDVDEVKAADAAGQRAVDPCARYARGSSRSDAGRAKVRRFAYRGRARPAVRRPRRRRGRGRRSPASRRPPSCAARAARRAGGRPTRARGRPGSCPSPKPARPKPSTTSWPISSPSP